MALSVAISAGFAIARITIEGFDCSATSTASSQLLRSVAARLFGGATPAVLVLPTEGGLFTPAARVWWVETEAGLDGFFG